MRRVWQGRQTLERTSEWFAGGSTREVGKGERGVVGEELEEGRIEDAEEERDRRLVVVPEEGVGKVRG